MRRTLTHFQVTGSDHKDLVEQARIQYAAYMGVPDAPLPPAASMEVQPEVWDGSGNITLWRGEVTVTVTS